MVEPRPRLSIDGAAPRAQSYAGYSTLHPLQEAGSSSSSSSRPAVPRTSTGFNTGAGAGVGAGGGGQRPQRPQTLFLSPSYSHPSSSYAIDASPSRSKMIRSVSAVGAPSLAMESETVLWRGGAQGETPLDKTINVIGMGRYQWALLLLTGCGYAADNAWLQGVAIILPRVQKDFEVPDGQIGLLSSCTFAGMMLGAFAWGTWSDANGRKLAFDGTLLLVTIFGFLSAFAGSFSTLCLGLFCLGLGLGGSMPTDGLVFVENLPKEKQYLLTFLSVFFSMGSVASSVLGLLIIPGSVQRWRWFLGSLAALTTFFLSLRIVFFRLIESPRYLASSGRYEEAREALQKIAAYNGAPLPVALSDVRDQAEVAGGGAGGGGGGGGTSRQGKSGRQRQTNSRGGYSAVASDDPLEASEGADEATEQEERAASQSAPPKWAEDWLPAALGDALSPLLAKYGALFDDQWRLTTVLVWSIWTSVSLAYTMFNVFLPKFLESRLTTPTAPSEPSAVMRDYLFYALASLPGSLLGAWTVETRLGRKGTMALSLALTAMGMLSFIQAGERWQIILSSMLISLTATTAYAALYGYTPEVFETEVRGTASGTASGLSRLAGIIAPLLAGWLFSISINVPLVLSVILFVTAAAMCLALPIETRRVREVGEESDET